MRERVSKRGEERKEECRKKKIGGESNRNIRNKKENNRAWRQKSCNVLHTHAYLRFGA